MAFGFAVPFTDSAEPTKLAWRRMYLVIVRKLDVIVRKLDRRHIDRPARHGPTPDSVLQSPDGACPLRLAAAQPCIRIGRVTVLPALTSNVYRRFAVVPR